MAVCFSTLFFAGWLILSGLSRISFLIDDRVDSGKVDELRIWIILKVDGTPKIAQDTSDVNLQKKTDLDISVYNFLEESIQYKQDLKWL